MQKGIMKDQSCKTLLRSPSQKRMRKSIKPPIFHIQQGQVLPARYLSSPHWDTRPNEKDISLLVIHYISLPPQSEQCRFIDDFFLGQLNVEAHPYFVHLANIRVSAHCLIDRQGRLTQYVNLNKRAWHAGKSHFQGRDKCNDFSIGIELIGSNEQPFTSAQYATLLGLTQAIQHTYPAITQERIVGHCHIAPQRKIDPGKYFDWAYFFSQLSPKKCRKDKTMR